MTAAQSLHSSLWLTAGFAFLLLVLIVDLVTKIFGETMDQRRGFLLGSTAAALAALIGCLVCTVVALVL